MTLSKNIKTILLILIAFAFSFSVRLIWVDQFSDYEQFKFNDQFMINTNDGYLYAEGARDILAGFHQENDLSPIDQAAPILTAFLVKYLPFSFETVIFYMPAFFASLLVIPIILIAREFDKLEVGFIAALVGSIAWSYYNRTMVGYYDTDLLNIVFPTILLWSLIWAVTTKQDKYLLIAALDSIAYRWWYPQSYSLEFAFIGLIGIYVVYQYLKKQEFQTNLLLITFMLFAMINIDAWIRLVLVFGFYGLLKTKKELLFKYIYYIFGLGLVLFFATGGFDPILSQLKGYIFRESVAASEGLGVHFFTVNQTIREASSIPFETFANRISGHTITFLASIVGYIWFAKRYPVMLLGLPMIGLGFLAYGIPGLINGGGLRFTVYAVPLMALGLGFLIVEIASIATKNLKTKTIPVLRYTIITLLTAGALYPNIQHIYGYKVPTVFTQKEVKILDDFKNITSREAYMVTWWDYGYPIRYYSDLKTLIDGGKHSGAVNYPISFALTNPQELGAKMARLDVEYTEKRFDKNISYNWEKSNIAQMSLDYGYKDLNNFLIALETDIKLPAKTRDIYFYLPNRMLNIFPTVELFSNLDLMSGTKYSRSFFYKSNTIKNTKNSVDLGNRVEILKNTGEIKIGNQKTKINSFVTTYYDKNRKLKVQKQTISQNADYFVIFMKNYNQFLVLDKKLYNSLFIQLFVLENYNKDLFEPVVLDPMAKIYKLKI